MLPRAKKRQLQQLAKFDPVAHQRATRLLDRGYIALASEFISTAMKSLLVRRAAATPVPAAASVDDLYHRLAEWVRDQPVIAPRQEIELMKFNGRPVRVRRGHNNELRLRIGAGPSVYVGFWGSDDAHISSRAGAWKISSQARENLKKLV